MARLRRKLGKIKKLLYFKGISPLVLDFLLFLSIFSIKVYSEHPYKSILVHIPIIPITIPKTSL